MAGISINASIPGLAKEPAFYAKEKFIKEQRLIAISMFVIAALAIFASTFTAGLTAGVAVPLIQIGSALIGASLIQQVVGDAYGCAQGKVKRVAAGILFIIGGPAGWAIGSLLWYFSNQDNRA